VLPRSKLLPSPGVHGLCYGPPTPTAPLSHLNITLPPFRKESFEMSLFSRQSLGILTLFEGVDLCI